MDCVRKEEQTTLPGEEGRNNILGDEVKRKVRALEVGLRSFDFNE